MISLQDQLTVAICGDLYEAVVIVIEDCFIAIGKNGLYCHPAAQEAPLYIFSGDVVTSPLATRFAMRCWLSAAVLRPI